jgi:urea carboxylase-associated protein 1
MQDGRFSAPPRSDEVIPAKAHWAREIEAGELLRLEDVEGQQAIDLICYAKDDLNEKFWAAHTAKLNGTIYVSTGHVLYSDMANPMMTIVADSVGVNDVICGSCSAALDEVRYGAEKAAPGCMDNFEAAIEPWGLSRADIPMCFNIFLDYPVREGGLVAMDREAPSRPGDEMVLRAEIDLLVAISNCPQENNPCTGFNPSPIRATIFPVGVPMPLVAGASEGGPR